MWSFDFALAGTLSRTLALRLPSGGWLVFNPGKGVTEAARQELADVGPVEALFGPNHYHHMGVRTWCKSLGRIPFFASDGALRRLTDKFKLTVDPIDELRAQLPDGVELVCARGSKNGEAWMTWGAGAEHSWAVGDAFFNFSHLEFSPAGLLLRATGGGPGLRISRVYSLIGIASRHDYRSWLLELLGAKPPRNLIPCHGEILRTPELPETLKRLVEKRL